MCFQLHKQTHNLSLFFNKTRLLCTLTCTMFKVESGAFYTRSTLAKAKVSEESARRDDRSLRYPHILRTELVLQESVCLWLVKSVRRKTEMLPGIVSVTLARGKPTVLKHVCTVSGKVLKGGWSTNAKDSSWAQKMPSVLKWVVTLWYTQTEFSQTPGELGLLRYERGASSILHLLQSCARFRINFPNDNILFYDSV